MIRRIDNIMEFERIKSPQDIKRLNISQLSDAADYIRRRIVSVVEKNGGHLSSNLGTVELTVALHYVFDCPHDKIVFDVGHQAYAHKIITGRDEAFDGLRQNGGISGFQKPDESEYDAFGTGDSSTSLSVAQGLAEAARAQGINQSTVAVIGDGALTGGLAYEALNSIGSESSPVIIVLNDNEMSISKNVGAMSNHLTRLRIGKKYSRLKNDIKRSVSVIPFFGDGAIALMERGKSFLKKIVLSNKIFESMGITYYGPFDGHNIAELVDVFSQAKKKNGPLLVHVVTDKGRGLKSAAVDPVHSHGVAAVSGLVTERAQFSQTLGKFLISAAERDDRIVAVTAAMAIGTGLEEFSKRFPDRFKDVGIAEEHAVTYCAALAAGGMKPYFAVYSTFLQRGFDELLHDVCIGGYPVTFCIDRAGTAGSDGVTHQGLFDLSYLGMLPNMTVMCPTDGDELASMLEFSRSFGKPLAVRYPKDYVNTRVHAPIEYGKWEILRKSDSKTYVLCSGPRAVDEAEKAAKRVDMNIVNARFVKPLDAEFLKSINKVGNVVVTMEDNVLHGGFGQSVLCALDAFGRKAECITLGYPDEFADDRSVRSSLEKAGLTEENLIKVLNSLKRK